MWVLVALLALLYVALRRFSEPGTGSRWRLRAWTAGIAALWLALDWPIGALSGYLASAHMVQYLLISLVAAPLLLLGVPEGAWDRLARRGAAVRVLRLTTHPLIALGIFQFLVFYTHLPSVVDGLMASSFGSFIIDMMWLGGGLLFWWPVVAPVPRRRRFGYPLKMGYLFLSTVLNTMPYAFLTFGELPFYGIYELAPPVIGLDARQDQQLAGLLMKVGGGLILWTAITVLFFRWHGREGEREGPVPAV